MTCVLVTADKRVVICGEHQFTAETICVAPAGHQGEHAWLGRADLFRADATILREDP